MHSRQQLGAELRSLGIAPGDVVMAHASVRAIGEVAGGPDEIHLALKDALAAEGTLLREVIERSRRPSTRWSRESTWIHSSPSSASTTLA